MITPKELKPKQIATDRDAREKVKQGLDISCNAIKSTIGPCGRNAFIDMEMQPTITNDGVSIARSMVFEDNFNQMGAWLVNNTCDKSFDDVGDATTTTATLLQAIIDESLKRPENPIKIRRALKTTGKKIEQWIKDSSKPVKTNEEIKDIATIAGESESIGQMIADLIKKVGNKPIRVTEHNFPEIETEIVDGLETKVGYASPLFITNEQDKTAEIENVLVFASDRNIATLSDLNDLMVLLQQKGITTIVFLVANMGKNVIGTYAINKKAGIFNSLVVEVRGQELEDMCAVTGATLISESTGIKLKEVTEEHLGFAKKITTTDKKTLIIGRGDEKTKHGVELLRKKAEQTQNIYEAQALNKRADDIEGGIALIKVGAPTDTERTDLKLKITNAVNATKTAMEEGIVEGGGMCLYRIANKIKGNSIGDEILKTALKSPLKNIIENAGEEYADVVKKITKKKGYNANENRMCDMFKSGIIDSAKSTRCAFTNALSTASEFVTVGTSITPTQDDKTTQ